MIRGRVIPFVMVKKNTSLSIVTIIGNDSIYFNLQSNRYILVYHAWSSERLYNHFADVRTILKQGIYMPHS